MNEEAKGLGLGGVLTLGRTWVRYPLMPPYLGQDLGQISLDAEGL